jgi:MoxR-like ATPase
METKRQKKGKSEFNNLKDLERIPEESDYVTREIIKGESWTDLQEFSDAMKKGYNILLEGPTGSGKTSLVRYWCYKNQQSYYRINLNGGCTAEDLVGHYILHGGETIWLDGILTRAVKNGWVAVVDEINAAPADILFVLNPLLDDDRDLIITQKNGGEICKVHENFRFVATCNPNNKNYSGTKELNEALKDRFQCILYVDYDIKIDERILSKSGLEKDKIKDVLNFTKAIRESYENSEIQTPFGTRQVINFAEKLREGKHKLILNRFNIEDRPIVEDLLDVFIDKNKSIEQYYRIYSPRK